MERLARERGWQRGIELGLGHGLLFARFLALGINMIGVDIGARAERRAAVNDAAARYEPRARVFWMSTQGAAPLVADHWADFIFIDAAHSYPAVKDDIARWLPKVRKDGWFGGHDYHPAHPGVIRAVDEAFGECVDRLPGDIWVRRC